MAMQAAKNAVDIGIIVRDIEASLAFYRDRLGLEKVQEVPLGFGTMHRLAFGDSFIKLVDPNNIPMAAQATAIYKIISASFSKEDFIDLCTPLGIDPENLRDSSKNSMAQDLFGKAQRTGRLDVLVKQIAAMRPDTVDMLKGNLFVFLEGVPEHEVPQLCQELNLDCRALQLDENGLLGYAANSYIRVERMQALQDHMVQNGRYADLVQAAKKYLPRTDFSTFER